MASYLALTEDEQECRSCSRKAGPGLVGFTDEHTTGPPLVPICGACLHGLDPRLYVVWRLAKGWAWPLEHALDGDSIIDVMEKMPPDCT